VTRRLILQLSPSPPSSSAPIKSRMETFWYRHICVVLEHGRETSVVAVWRCGECSWSWRWKSRGYWRSVCACWLGSTCLWSSPSVDSSHRPPVPTRPRGHLPARRRQWRLQSWTSFSTVVMMACFCSPCRCTLRNSRDSVVKAVNFHPASSFHPAGSLPANPDSIPAIPITHYCNVKRMIKQNQWENLKFDPCHSKPLEQYQLFDFSCFSSVMCCP